MPTYFETIDAGLIRYLVDTSIINKPRENNLKDTQSWSNNSLIKIFFKVKENMKEAMPENIKNIKDFVNDLRQQPSLVIN